MKKLLLLCFALSLLLVPSFVFAASCDSAGESDYFIKFTIEGEEYICSFGHPNSDIDVPYAAVTTGFLAQPIEEELIEFYGGTIDTGSLPEELNSWVEVAGYLHVETAGTYTGVYTLGLMNNVRISIYNEPDFYIYYAQSGTVTIDVFNDIGGSVEGSFDASFVIGGDLVFSPLELGDSPQPVTGTFRVKRVSEEDLPEPLIN